MFAVFLCFHSHDRLICSRDAGSRSSCGRHHHPPLINSVRGESDHVQQYVREIRDRFSDKDECFFAIPEAMTTHTD